MTFARACATAEVALGSARATMVDGVPVAVVATDDGWFAIHDECSHAAVPLSDGDVEDSHIECYMHGSPSIPSALMATTCSSTSTTRIPYRRTERNGSQHE